MLDVREVVCYTFPNETQKEESQTMTRETMIEVARNAAKNEPIDPYWGEPLSVMRVIVACAGYEPHVGGYK